MTIFHEPLVLIHLLGFAILLGSVFFYKKENNKIALRASIIQVVTGVLLMFAGEKINHMKIGIKFLILLAILLLVFLWRNKSWTQKERGIIGGLVLVNVMLAVLW